MTYLLGKPLEYHLSECGETLLRMFQVSWECKKKIIDGDFIAIFSWLTENPQNCIHKNVWQILGSFLILYDIYSQLFFSVQFLFGKYQRNSYDTTVFIPIFMGRTIYFCAFIIFDSIRYTQSLCKNCFIIQWYRWSKLPNKSHLIKISIYINKEISHKCIFVVLYFH